MATRRNTLNGSISVALPLSPRQKTKTSQTLQTILKKPAGCREKRTIMGKLRFAGTEPSTFPIQRLDNMSEEEIDAIWFSALECAAMKQDASYSAETFAAGFKDVDMRGLESLSEQGAWLSYKARQDLYAVVLGEQEKNERGKSKTDWDALARLSIQETAKSLSEALMRGKKDQKEARLAYISPPLPWSIRSKKPKKKERRTSMQKVQRRSSMPALARKPCVETDNENEKPNNAEEKKKKKLKKTKKQKKTKKTNKKVPGIRDSLEPGASSIATDVKHFYESPKPRRKKLSSQKDTASFNVPDLERSPAKSSRRSRSNMSERSTDVTVDLSDMSDSSTRDLSRSDSTESFPKTATTKKIAAGHSTKSVCDALPGSKEEKTIPASNKVKPADKGTNVGICAIQFPTSPIKKKNSFLPFASPKKGLKSVSPLLSPSKKKSHFLKLGSCDALSATALSPSRKIGNRHGPRSPFRNKSSH